MKQRDVIRMLHKDGWYVVPSKSGHRQFKHPVKRGRVTVSVHGSNREMPPGVLNSILRQAGLK